MEKIKLELLLEEVSKLNFTNELTELAGAYNAYMEERKTLPQVGQEIQVWYDEGSYKEIEKFVGFTSYGKVVTEDKKGVVTTFDNYSTLIEKKKYKVVKLNTGALGLFYESENTGNCPIITTFED